MPSNAEAVIPDGTLTLRTKFTVTCNAEKWWVRIEPIDRQIDSPGKTLVVDLQAGQDYTVIYYFYGEGKTFELSITHAGKEVAKVPKKTIKKGKKMFYGHKSFNARVPA